MVQPPEGLLPEDEVAAELVTGFLTRATKIDLGPENLSNRLLGTAKHRVRDVTEEGLKQLVSEFATAEEEALEAA